MRSSWTVPLLFLFAVTALADDDGLRVRLTLESPRAIIGIPVGSELIIENHAKKPSAMPRWAYYRAHYLPTDEWMIVRPKTGPYAVDLHESAPKVIAPGQTVTIPDMPSLWLFTTLVGGPSFLRPGTYVIDVVLSEPGLSLPALSAGGDPVRGPHVAALSAGLVTPPVTFDVEAPSSEDALVWARIAEITLNGTSTLGTVRRPGEWIRPLVLEHPDSIYVPYISPFFALDEGGDVAFTAKWLARDLPPSVKDLLQLRRIRALERLANVDRTVPSSNVYENEALSIANRLTKQSKVPGMKEDAQKIIDEIVWRRAGAKDPDSD